MEVGSQSIMLCYLANHNSKTIMNTIIDPRTMRPATNSEIIRELRLTHELFVSDEANQRMDSLLHSTDKASEPGFLTKLFWKIF